mmetsp:Transcript_18535/g.34339  ORF Transcript_18535/g.34339 Transcript_18535/m.34339 type:complete len:753 (-) Transcript_18535:41-2299(-)
MRAARLWLCGVAVALAAVVGRADAGMRDDGAGDVYLFGASKVDVTGPVAQVTMMGYADIMQRATGLLNRLYARAFVVEQGAERVAIVHCDLHSIPLLLHNKVIDRLQEEYGDKYGAHNVMIHGQHTHASPGGLHTYFLYAFATLGYTDIQFHMVIDQIVHAVRKADASMEPKRLYVGHETADSCSTNRSPDAYLHNPEEERAFYGDNRNTQMTVVKATAVDDPEDVSALWTFFAVHTTSLPGTSTVISSDNKGFAEWAMEKVRGDDFIAAFFESEAGDISPNTYDNKDKAETFTGPFRDDYIRSTEAIGQCQANAAERALASPNWTPLTGSIVARKSFFDFSSYQVGGDPTKTTCPAVSGLHMLAGTEDGRGPFHHVGMREGRLRTENHPLLEFVGKGFLNIPLSDEIKACHAPKVPMIVTGVQDYKYTPPVLPVQLILIGSFGIVAAPFEVATMAGRRIAATVKDAVKDRAMAHVAIAADSNAYAGYLVTREEYQAQHYEGACTHFGPNQLEAIQDMLVNLAQSASPRGAVSRPDPTPFKSFSVFNDVGTVLLAPESGAVPPWQTLGGLHSDVPVGTALAQGQVAAATFWCARPMNSQIQVESFCDLEQLDERSGEWKVALRDHDWNVRFLWGYKFLSYSVCTCQWAIPRNEGDHTGPLPPGSREFRLRFRGIVEDSSTHQPKLYTGVSSAFTVGEERVAPINLSPMYTARTPDEVVFGATSLLIIAILACAMSKCYARATATPASKRKAV